MATRLAADYRPRIAELGGELIVWANSTQVGVEIPLGGRLRRRWTKHVRYARRFTLVNKTQRFKSFVQVDAELREMLDGWVKQTLRG